MPTYELSITLRAGGQDVPGFPILRRIEVDEAQSAVIDLASDSTLWTALPSLSIDTLNFLFVTTDRPIAVRLNGLDLVSTPSIPLNAGGMLALIDTTLDAGAGAANARVQNVGPLTVSVRSFTGGT